MQVRLFTTFCARHPHVSPAQMDEYFTKYGIWNFIQEGYAGLHCEGDEVIYAEIMDIFTTRGVAL